MGVVEPFQRCETYLVPLFTARHRASERLLVASVHAHGTEDGLGADGALGGPRLVAVGLLEVHILFVALATCERVETQSQASRWTNWPLRSTGPQADRCESFQLSSASQASVPIMATSCVTVEVSGND